MCSIDGSSSTTITRVGRLLRPLLLLVEPNKSKPPTPGPSRFSHLNFPLTGAWKRSPSGSVAALLIGGPNFIEIAKLDRIVVARGHAFLRRRFRTRAV